MWGFFFFGIIDFNLSGVEPVRKGSSKMLGNFLVHELPNSTFPEHSNIMESLLRISRLIFYVSLLPNRANIGDLTFFFPNHC